MAKIHQVKRTPTDFQQPVDETDLLFQLKREIGGETVLEVTELDAGLSNNTYHVRASDNSYILKVAPGSQADVFYNERYLMRRERSISDQLPSVSPLVPRYLSFFSIGGRDAFLQPFVQGRLWHDVIGSLSADENSGLSKQLGAFAKALHGNAGETFGYPAPLQGFSHWSGFIANNLEGMVEDCRRHGIFCPEIQDYLNCLPHFFRVLDQVANPRLLHGDLWPRNVIISGEGASIHIKAVPGELALQAATGN